MFMLTRGRMDCTVLDAAARKSFFEHYAARSAATRRDGKSEAEIIGELESRFAGIEIRRWTLKEGVLERLRCGWCGGRLVLDGIYIRITVEPFRVRKFSNGNSREEGPARIANILPRLKCRGGAPCARGAGAGGFKTGATHVAFPPYICPFWRIPLPLVSDLALAQRRLEVHGFGKADAFGIMELSRRDPGLAGLLRRHGEVRWLCIAGDWLNRSAGRRALRFAASLLAAYRSRFAEAHLELARRASGSAAHGTISRRRYSPPSGRRPLSCLLAFLLSWPARTPSSWPLFHPRPPCGKLGPPG